MQPYQKAGEEFKRQSELPLKALKTVGSIAGTAASAYAGGNIIGKVLPFLNRYIPEDLAIKGLSKIDPRFGKFINKALSAGKSFDEIKDFIKEKIETQEQEEEKLPEIKALENKNANIENLYNLAQKGKTQGNQFLKFSNQLIKSQDIPDYETFSNFYKWWHVKPNERRGTARSEFELFRREIGDTLRNDSMNQKETQSNQSLQQQTQGQSQQNQQQQLGQGQQALMSIMQKINQKLGG
jgi:hypothetical protein